MTTTIELPRRIYTDQALRQAIEAFANLCTASFTTEQNAYMLQVRTAQPQIRNEFLNYALGLSARELLR